MTRQKDISNIGEITVLGKIGLKIRLVTALNGQDIRNVVGSSDQSWFC